MVILMVKEDLKAMARSLISAENQQEWVKQRLIEKGFSEEVIRKFEEDFQYCYQAKKGAQYLNEKFGVDVNRRYKNIPFTEEELNTAYERAAVIIESEASEGKINEVEKGHCFGILREYFSKTLFEKEKNLADSEKSSEYFGQLSSGIRKVRALKTQMQKEDFPIDEFMDAYFAEKFVPENQEEATINFKI